MTRGVASWTLPASPAPAGISIQQEKTMNARYFQRHPGVWLAAALASALPITVEADPITDWNTIAAATVVGALPAERASNALDFPMMHIAIYDAVNAIDRRYRPFVVKPSALARGASREAAVVAAAYGVLSGSIPSRQPQLLTAFNASLAAIPDGDAKSRGIALGAEVATAVLNWRADDGRLSPAPVFVPGSGAGDYQFTPPGFVAPVLSWLPNVRPFALRSADQFRAPGPPDPTSAEFADDFNETKRLGALNGSTRTDAQTETGRFHTENPTTFWGRNLGTFAAAQGFDLADHARFMAQVFVALGDATIGCFDSKYYFRFWRPVSAITTTLDDGNAGTQTQADWLPLANTPPHPEYPAAHACVAGAVTRSIHHVLGPQEAMTFTSTVAGTVPHEYARAQDLVDEIILARVYGGMHYRGSGIDGARLGRRTADWVAARHFKRREGAGDHK
jgi:hypothetical protein